MTLPDAVSMSACLPAKVVHERASGAHGSRGANGSDAGSGQCGATATGNHSRGRWGSEGFFIVVRMRRTHLVRMHQELMHANELSPHLEQDVEPRAIPFVRTVFSILAG